jgi:hypothetical protein
VPLTLAPVSHVIAAARIPLPLAREQDRPYLWLAGLAFAVLAIAGSALLALSLRVFRLGWN